MAIKDLWTKGACMDADPELFAGHDAEIWAAETAKRYCAHCPVLAQCAQLADQDHLEGLWGGAWREDARKKPRRPNEPAYKVTLLLRRDEAGAA